MAIARTGHDLRFKAADATAEQLETGADAAWLIFCAAGIDPAEALRAFVEYQLNLEQLNLQCAD